MEGSSTTSVLNYELMGLMALNQEIAQFNYGNVVVCRNYSEIYGVRVISGSSGTSYARFVGRGMLAAAIIQDDPPKCHSSESKTILRTIRELNATRSNGILVIIRSNTVDILNFGVSVERCISDTLDIKLLNVDDICMNNSDYKFGLSGVILISKIAGAMSEKFKSLTDTYKFGQECVQNLASIALTVNGSVINDEPNAKKIKVTRTQVVETLLHNIIDAFTPKLPKFKSVVILINNIGALSPGHEEHYFVKELTTAFQSLSISVCRLYIGDFLTFPSDSNIDLTITLLEVFKPEVLEYLDVPCKVPGWKNVNQFGLNKVDGSSEKIVISAQCKERDRFSMPIRGPVFPRKGEKRMLFAFKYALSALKSCRNQLNTIGSESGNDTIGNRFRRAAKFLRKRIKRKKMITAQVFTFFECLSKIAEKKIGGKLGSMYGILIEAVATSFGKYTDDDVIRPKMWLEALEYSSETIQRYSNASQGGHAIYEVLHACSSEIKSELEKMDDARDIGSIMQAFEKGVEKAQLTAQNFKKDENQKFPDPGAHSIGIWLRAVYEGLKLKFHY